MISISITEKLWDDVRPSSVKKTGLSEAIRAFAKAAPKGAPDAPKAYDDLDKAIDALSKAIAGAETQIKKASDDKKGAAAKLKTWLKECEAARATAATLRAQTGLLKAGVEAEGLAKASAGALEDAIKQAQKLLADINSQKVTDPKTIAVALQDLRNVARDCLKWSQKDTFSSMITTRPAVLAWGVDPAKVPMGASAKAMKARVVVLQQEIEQARIAAEKSLESTSKNRTGAAADLAKDLVKDYRALAADIKSRLTKTKKLSADAKALGDKFKKVIAVKPDADKLFPEVQKMQALVLKFEEASLKEIARGRVASGDIQGKRIKIRDSLKGDTPTYTEFEKIASEEWNLIMVIFREVTEEFTRAYQQVDRVARLIGETSADAAATAEKLSKTFTTERNALRNQYAK